MAELWQSYGSWVFYGLFFVVMVLLHGRRHGHGGHGSHSSHEPGPDTNAGQQDAAGGHAHGDGGKPATRAHRGCC
jgi:hypothetical protein